MNTGEKKENTVDRDKLKKSDTKNFQEKNDQNHNGLNPEEYCHDEEDLNNHEDELPEECYVDDESITLLNLFPAALKTILSRYLPKYSNRLSSNLREILVERWFITLTDLPVGKHIQIRFEWENDNIKVTVREVSITPENCADFPHLVTSTTNLIRILKGDLNPQIALLNGLISTYGNSQTLYVFNIFNCINCKNIIRMVEKKESHEAEESIKVKSETQPSNHLKADTASQDY